MASQSIEIRSLYKIFGPKAGDYVEPVKAGMSKSDLNAKHGHVLGLRDINITMPGGQITVIMGLSGSGKSTLIRHVNRLIDPTAGEILYGGTDVCRLNEADLLEFRRHKTAMVFQKFGLLPHRNVLQNVVYGLEVQGVDKREREERAEVWIRRVGLEGFSNHYPNQLSGGMQQRAAICRALVHDPDILLMDEPFGALDALTREIMTIELLRIWAKAPKTIVFVTHSIPEAVLLADRVVVMSPRPGRIAEIIDVDLPRPRNFGMSGHPEFQRCAGRIRELIFGDQGTSFDVDH